MIHDTPTKCVHALFIASVIGPSYIRYPFTLRLHYRHLDSLCMFILQTHMCVTCHLVLYLLVSYAIRVPMRSCLGAGLKCGYHRVAVRHSTWPWQNGFALGVSSHGCHYRPHDAFQVPLSFRRGPADPMYYARDRKLWCAVERKPSPDESDEIRVISLSREQRKD